MSYLEIVKTCYKGKTQTLLKPIFFLKQVCIIVSNFCFIFSAAVSPILQTILVTDAGFQKHLKIKKGTTNSRNIFFLTPCISTFHSNIVKLWFTSCGSFDILKCFFRFQLMSSHVKKTGAQQIDFSEWRLVLIPSLHSFWDQKRDFSHSVQFQTSKFGRRSHFLL